LREGQWQSLYYIAKGKLFYRFIAPCHAKQPNPSTKHIPPAATTPTEHSSSKTAQTGTMGQAANQPIAARDVRMGPRGDYLKRTVRIFTWLFSSFLL